MRQKRNKFLAERSSDYDALTQHVNQDYREDEELARAIVDTTNKLVDLNYDDEELAELLTWDDPFTISYIRFGKTEQLKRWKAMKRPLLSQDLAEYRHLAKMHVEFAGSACTEVDCRN